MSKLVLRVLREHVDDGAVTFTDIMRDIHAHERMNELQPGIAKLFRTENGRSFLSATELPKVLKKLSGLGYAAKQGTDGWVATWHGLTTDWSDTK